MGKIDEIKEIKSDIKEVFKALLYLMLGVLTGIVTLAYNVLIQKIPAYMIIVGGIGLVIAALIGMYELNFGIKCKN